MHLEHLKTLLRVPDLASKKWIYEQYDSQVMNDTIQTGGDASIVRVRGTQKALAITVDCTPRYVEADPFEGAKQAVAETYRNISAVGGKPLAITNCLNFGNPQKPEIMGQIVRAIRGINEACKALDYPVISGNVSLYNETDGKAIQPTPAIGGVGLLQDLNKRCDTKFKILGDEVFVIGKSFGHLSCSLFEREILKIDSKKNPPKVDLIEEKKNSEFVRELIKSSIINACHDISDGGLLVALFEMCNEELGCELDNLISSSADLFSEDQSRYIVALDSSMAKELKKMADKKSVELKRVAVVVKEKIKIGEEKVAIKDLQNLNESVFEKNFN
ncbi:MAG: hypothetical protein KGP29_06335 [Proteobacteria bacterium]|nr:hypothetical protein [Pseudomonadota bacterium]